MTTSFDYGDRVSYFDGAVNWLGVVSDPTGTILLDNGKYLRTDLSNLMKVDYWKEVDKPFKNGVAIAKFQTYIDNKKIFKGRKAVAVTKPLLNAMWFWLNYHAFGGKLNKIELKLMQSKSPLGLYRTGGGQDSRILISTHLPTMLSIFTVMAHEMIHQHNFEFDVPHNVYDYSQISNHGIGFRKEAERVSKLLGLNIKEVYEADTQVDDAGNITKTDYSDVERGRKYAYFLIKSTSGHYFGFYVKQKSKIGPTKMAISSYARASRTLGSTLWGGISDTALPLKYLYQFNMEGKHDYKSISTEALRVLKHNSKPLDIVESIDDIKV